MAAFPSDLYNCILKSSLRERVADNRIRSNMDVGPAKIRRRTTANTRPISFTLTMNSDQLDQLIDFWNDDTFGGVDAFDFTHPRTNEAVKVRFVEPFEYSDQEAVLYNIPLSLEIMPQ